MSEIAIEKKIDKIRKKYKDEFIELSNTITEYDGLVMMGNITL